MTKPKRTALPGGAPVEKPKSKRPCKYGPRTEEGLCPKKPKAPKKTVSGPKKTVAASASKKPCKYGARVNGKCPPKPREVKDYKTVSAASKQAGEVLRSKTATTDQKKEAVKVLGTAVAVESGKKVAANVYRETKVAAKKAIKKNPKAAAAAAKTAAKVAGTATGVGVVVVAGGAALTANRKREAAAFAKAEVAKTKKRMGGKLTAEQERILYDQYYQFALKKPVVNPVLGK